MLQIIIWMLCVYLVLKGIELRLIAASSTHESREANLGTANVGAIIAVLAAVGFFVLSLNQGNPLANSPLAGPLFESTSDRTYSSSSEEEDLNMSADEAMRAADAALENAAKAIEEAMR